MKRILLATIVAFFMSNAYGATEWCVNDTMKCAHGTPPLSKLKLVDRQASLYKLTVADRNAAVAEGLYIPVTVNELIVLAKEYLASQVVIPEPEPTPEPVPVEPDPEPVNILDGKVQCGSEFGWCGFGTSDQVTRQVWFGGASGLSLPKTVTGWGTNCGRNHFEGAESLVETNCFILGNPPVVVEPEPEPAPVEPEVPPPHHHGNMPYIDETKNPAPAIGFSDSRIRLNSHQPPASQGGGDFRIQCDYSHTGVYDWSPEVVRWGCGVYTGRQNHIPACNGTLDLMLQFPTCWDGVNLDSPDHKSHVVYSDGGSCPSTHPKKIPNITYNIHYPVPNGTSHLRLASDNYVGGAGGYSAHGDYMFAWNGETLTKWFNNCIKARRDCHANLLGNGEELY
jgi:hypothetical protein